MPNTFKDQVNMYKYVSVVIKDITMCLQIENLIENICNFIRFLSILHISAFDFVLTIGYSNYFHLYGIFLIYSMQM